MGSAKQAAAELQADRQRRQAEEKTKSPEELEAEREAERLAREDAEKARHETAEGTCAR